MFTVSSSAQNIEQRKAGMSLSEEELIDKAMEALHIDESKTGFVVAEVYPSNSKETIIVIEEIAKEEEGSSESYSHIVIIENTTGKITHKYFESSETNGWESDAIFMDNITIDTLTYKLNASENAFGAKVRFRNNSQPNPYNYETISLFTKEKNSLKKILDFYTLYEDWGEVNVNSCYAAFDKTVNTLSMSDIKTNGYNDILVKHTFSKIIYEEDKNGDCNPKELSVTTEKRILKFNGEVYEEEKEFKEKINHQKENN